MSKGEDYLDDFHRHRPDLYRDSVTPPWGGYSEERSREINDGVADFEAQAERAEELDAKAEEAERFEYHGKVSPGGWKRLRAKAQAIVAEHEKEKRVCQEEGFIVKIPDPEIPCVGCEKPVYYAEYLFYHGECEACRGKGKSYKFIV